MGEKDEHVLVAAPAIGAEILLTLDKPLIERVNEAPLGIEAYTPGNFITHLLPTHPEYPHVR